MDWHLLHNYWFAKQSQFWFGKDDNADKYIRNTFAPWLDHRDSKMIQDWRKNDQGYLTLIILLDQIPRNSFRNQKRSFAYDAQALMLCREGLDKKDSKLTVYEKLFFYLPLDHSEDVLDQNLSVQCFEKLAAVNTNTPLQSFTAETLLYARRHREIIQRFGRFPHRNVILGRTSTPEEIAFLQEPMSSF